jgi:hypothetical protein
MVLRLREDDDEIKNNSSKRKALKLDEVTRGSKQKSVHVYFFGTRR